MSNPIPAAQLPAFIKASMPAPSDGRGDVTLTGVMLDGSERTLATWSDTVSAADTLLVDRSPDGLRAAVALGKFVRTLSATDGSVITREPIGHSESSVVFGWPEHGEVVVRDTDAPSGPALPLADGWVLGSGVDIEQDHGFSGGHTGGGHLDGVPGSPLAAGALVRRPEAAARADQAGLPLVVELEKDGRLITATSPTPAGPLQGPLLHWPPIVGPTGVLLRHSNENRSMAPLLVGADGTTTVIPVELGNAPLCVLPDGRFLLPGADELWRDAADEPIHALSASGSVDPVLFGGAPMQPSQILAAIAPDLLPQELPADPSHPAWTGDEGFWVHAARPVAAGAALVVLLAEASWVQSSRHRPDGCRWLVVQLPLEANGAPRLLARGERAEGESLSIAL